MHSGGRRGCRRQRCGKPGLEWKRLETDDGLTVVLALLQLSCESDEEWQVDLACTFGSVRIWGVHWVVGNTRSCWGVKKAVLSTTRH